MKGDNQPLWLLKMQSWSEEELPSLLVAFLKAGMWMCQVWNPYLYPFLQLAAFLRLTPEHPTRIGSFSLDAFLKSTGPWWQHFGPSSLHPFLGTDMYQGAEFLAWSWVRTWSSF